MLSKFIYNDCFKKVPYTGNNYELDCNGILRESVSKKIINSYLDGHGIARIEPVTGEWFDGLSLAVVLGVVHRNSLIPPRLLNQLEVIYKNDTPSISLYKFIWKCPEGKLNHPLYPGFSYIPGFSRYLINQEGDVLSPIKGSLLESYINADGYAMYGLQPDVGGRTIVGKHRLLGLAWLPYSTDVDKLDINHIDTDVGCNELSNLEWATRSKNSLHAHASGLANSKRVMVRDITSKKVEVYYSISECARQLALSDETVRQRILKGSDGRVYDGMQFKWAEDTNPWVTFDTIDKYKWANRPFVVTVKWIKSGRIREFKTISAAAEYLRMAPSTLRYNLSKTKHVVLENHIVKVVYTK